MWLSCVVIWVCLTEFHLHLLLLLLIKWNKERKSHYSPAISLQTFQAANRSHLLSYWTWTCNCIVIWWLCVRTKKSTIKSRVQNNRKEWASNYLVYIFSKHVCSIAPLTTTTLCTLKNHYPLFKFSEAMHVHMYVWSVQMANILFWLSVMW